MTRRTKYLVVVLVAAVLAAWTMNPEWMETPDWMKSAIGSVVTSISRSPMMSSWEFPHR
jgi:hypothetical protein